MSKLRDGARTTRAMRAAATKADTMMYTASWQWYETFFFFVNAKKAKLARPRQVHLIIYRSLVNWVTL
jgi:hypothetical protein